MGFPDLIPLSAGSQVIGMAIIRHRVWDGGVYTHKGQAGREINGNHYLMRRFFYE